MHRMILKYMYGVNVFLFTFDFILIKHVIGIVLFKSEWVLYFDII